MSNLNDMAGTYNRYFSYSDFDNIDYYSDLTTRINQVITWKGEMDSKFNALYESVSKLSEAEINNTIKNLANSAINSLIASTNTELAKKLEKINIIAGNKITVTKTEDSNDITISADTMTETEINKKIKNEVDTLSKKVSGDISTAVSNLNNELTTRIDSLGSIDSLIKVIYLSNLIADNTDSTKDEIDLLQDYINNHKSNVEIVLDKSFTTIKQLDLSNCSNIKITGYAGNKITYNPEELTSLFKIDNSHDIYFDCLTCNSDNDNAILIGNRELAYHITIRNCRTYDCASLLMTHKIHDVTAENNFCYNSKGTAFAFLNDPYNLIVNNNVIEKGVNVQIKIYSTFESVGHVSENIIITNNRICDVTQGTGEWDMAMGIEINENSYNCVVSNNVLARCADMGISLSGAHKVTCNGNVIEGTNSVGYGSGIEIVACDDFICDSNLITGISHYGIILDKTYEGVVSSNNIVMIKSGWEPEDFCIMIGGMASPKNCHDLVISNNKLKFGTYGIRFNENLENIKIIGNLFENIFYQDISHDSPSSEILKSNITIENNTFDTSINIGGSKNIFINSNIFNIPSDSEGNRPYVSAIYIQKNSQYINIFNNIINNAYFIACFEKDDAEHTKATRIRIINNIIDYNSSLIDNADGLSNSDYYLTGNVDSSYSITPLNMELYNGSKVTKFSETVSINYNPATPSKLVLSSASAWDYAYFDVKLTAGTYKFVYTSDNLSVNADYCVGGADGNDMIRGVEGNTLTLVDGVYRFRFFVNGEEVPAGGQTTTYDNISLVRIS